MAEVLEATLQVKTSSGFSPFSIILRASCKRRLVSRGLATYAKREQ